MVNISSMLQDAESIKQARQATKINDLKIQGAEAGIERLGKLQDLIPTAITGDKQALNNVAAIDPESAKQIQDYLSKASDQEKADIADKTNKTAQLALFVKQSPDKQGAYVQALQAAQQMGVDTSSFPQQYTPEVEQFLDMSIAQAREIEDMLKPATQPTLKEIADPNSPTGTRYVRSEDAIGQPGKPASGMSLTSDGKGGFTLTQGRGGQKNGLESSTVREIEGKKFDSIETLSRVNRTSQSFKPEFLEIGTKMGAAWSSLKEKVGVKLEDSEKQLLTEYSEFKQAAFADMNLTMNILSGAAVSDQEFARMTQALPNAGSGIFDGDSPTVFKAKMEAVQRDQKRAIMRYNYALKNNQDPLATGIELSEVDALYDRRGAELEQIMRQQNPDMSEDVLEIEVLSRLKQEFGI